MPLKVVAAVLAGACVGSALGDAIPIQNSGFEDGPVGRDLDVPGWLEVDTPDTVDPGGLAADVGGLFILADQIPASPSGSRMVVLRNSPYKGLVEALSQDVPGLDPGRDYEVRFYFANAGLREFRPGRLNETGPGHLEVSLGDQTLASPTATFTGFGSQSWSTVALRFQPTTSNSALTIRAAGFIGGDGNTARLAVDGVTVCVVSEGCTLADLAAPFGLLDLADISAFTIGFVAMDPIADLNPDGLFDLSDVNFFVMSFLAGCP